MSTQTVDSPVTATMFTRRMGEAMRQQSVCIEIPVTIQGSRIAAGDASGSQGTKTFVEESRTMIVFPMGAVVRFSEPVSEGQVLILKNLRMNREVACRVVCSKTSANVKGFVEVEFVQPAVGFWGIGFPAAPSNGPAAGTPAAKPSAGAQPGKPAVIPTNGVISTGSATPGLAAPPSMQSGSFRAPVVAPPATPTLIPQAAQIHDSKPVPATVSIPSNGVDLNSAIAAAYSAPVESARKAEHEATTSVPAAKISNEALPLTIPVATADPIIEAAQPGHVDVAGLISEDRQIDESYSSHTKSAPASSSARTSAAFPIVIPDTHKSGSSQLHKLTAPAAQHSAHLSSDMSFGVERSEAKSGGKWMVAGIAALVVVSAAGAGGYWWYSKGNSIRNVAANSIVPAASSTQPVTTQPATVPAVTVPQNNPAPKSNLQTVPPPQNTTSLKTGSVGNNNSLAASNTRTPPATTNASGTGNVTTPAPGPAPAPARKPNILQGKIAAPVAPSGNSAASNVTAAPDITTPAMRTMAGAPILGGMNSLPAPPPAPVAATSSTPAPVSNIQQPRLISSVPPVYPKMAANRGDYGIVSVDALVNESGRVVSAKAISGPATLRESAADAVMQQRYTPPMLNGKPTSTHVTVNIEFKKRQ